MGFKWTSANKKVYNISYHLTFVTKYRKKVIKGKIEFKLKKYLVEKLKQLNITIIAFESMPDHVHIFIKCNPNTSIPELVKLLKGFSSYKIRSKFSSLKKLRSFWSPSYFCETIGHVSKKTIKKYIELQKTH